MNDEGADEIYPELQAATRRVLQLLRDRAGTLPPLADRLRKLRAARKVTQEELARRLGVQQAAISKLESRGEAASLRKLQEKRFPGWFRTGDKRVGQ
jgi:DNA-binding XRE family transcriptional regulator